MPAHLLAAQCENTGYVQRYSELFAMASVILQNVTKVYSYTKKVLGVFKVKSKMDNILVLQDINLNIRDKEFMVLTGPMGCGKVTLLHMIAGKEEISRGDVLIDGMRINGMAPRERRVAFVPQRPDLDPKLTVREIMAATLKGSHLGKKEIEDTVQKAAEIMDVAYLENRKTKALSRYQRQKVSLACALVCAPKVVLMEEPELGTDPAQRSQIRSDIIKLRKELDTTFIYAADDPMEALALGDRVAVIREGVLQQVGVPQEVYNYPCNLFVAEFFGATKMNFFDAMLVKNQGKYAVEVGGMTVELPEEKQKRLIGVDPQPIKLGVRPEQIELGKGLWGTVDMVETLGAVTHVHVDVQGYSVVVVVPTVNMTGANASLTRGAAVNVNIPGHACYLFDPDTERNLEL